MKAGKIKYISAFIIHWKALIPDNKPKNSRKSELKEKKVELAED
jgi:hypothetical protein